MNNLFWALLVLFLIAALVRMDWVYYLVYLVGGVWVFSHWWIRRSLSHVRMERIMPRFAFTNEHVPVKVRIENRAWLPLAWLQVRETIPPDLRDDPENRMVTSLGGRTSIDYAYQLYCRRRGYYKIGPLALNTSDLFGFVEARWAEAGESTIIVYPQIVPLHRLGLSSRVPFGDLSTRRQLTEDPTKLSGVRGYASGDSLRRIHWKATAHEGTLLVKKFQQSQELPLFIALDLARDAYPPRTVSMLSEWAISVAASVANHMSERRQAVGLATSGHDPLARQDATPIPARAGRDHLMTLLSLLARVQLNTGAPALHTWLPSTTAGLAWGTTLVVVTPKLEEPALWALHNIFRRGSSVIVMVCASQPDLAIMQARGKRLGVTVVSTIWESDLKALADDPAT